MVKGNRAVRELRKHLGLTQRQMARDTGLAAVYICQVETGANGLGRDGALAILDAYRSEMAERGLTLEDLLRGFRQEDAA